MSTQGRHSSVQTIWMTSHIFSLLPFLVPVKRFLWCTNCSQVSQSVCKNVFVMLPQNTVRKSLSCPLVEEYKHLYTSVFCHQLISYVKNHSYGCYFLTCGYNSPTFSQLVRQSGDPHALTHNGVRDHRAGGVTHGDARHRLRNGHCHRCHRYRHRCHRNRWRHPLGNGLYEGS